MGGLGVRNMKTAKIEIGTKIIGICVVALVAIGCVAEDNTGTGKLDRATGCYDQLGQYQPAQVGCIMEEIEPYLNEMFYVSAGSGTSSMGWLAENPEIDSVVVLPATPTRPTKRMFTRYAWPEVREDMVAGYEAFGYTIPESMLSADAFDSDFLLTRSTGSEFDEKISAIADSHDPEPWNEVIRIFESHDTGLGLFEVEATDSSVDFKAYVVLYTSRGSLGGFFFYEFGPSLSGDI